MALNNPTLFKGVTSIQKDNLTNNLLLGTQDFFSWGFLNVGGFQNITRSPAVSGSYGRTSDRFRLRNSDDPSFEEGQVWEGFRNDWVWESGFKYNETKPIHVSGVWIDGFFYKPNDPTYSHFIDYSNGRVVFDYPVPKTKKVEANFSHRTVGITLASEKFVQELMFDSYDIQDLDSYLISSSGNRNQLGARRLQLPIVALELGSSRGHRGWQLGGGQIAYNDLLFHVFADNEFEKNNIRDIKFFRKAIIDNDGDKNLSPGIPVAPVDPVAPVLPVQPVGPSIPSRFTLNIPLTSFVANPLILTMLSRIISPVW